MPMTRSVDATELELLPWDSDHFGFPVARLWGANLLGAVLRERLVMAREHEVHLVYWATNPEHEVPDWLLLEFSGRRVDQKATFERRLALGPDEETANPSPFEVSEIPPGQPSRRLVSLALGGGSSLSVSIRSTNPRRGLPSALRSLDHSLDHETACRCRLGDIPNRRSGQSPRLGHSFNRATQRERSVLIAIAKEARG